MKYLISALLLCTLVACGLFKHKSAKNNESPVARAYDKYLYPSDLAGVGKGAARPEDSVEAVKKYIDAWIHRQLLLHIAEENLPDNNEEMEKQLEDYRESITIYNYEKEYISQKMDTVVQEEEIKKYFNDHAQNFLLQTPILRMRYLMVPNNSRIHADSVADWLRSPNSFNIAKLKSFARSYAVKYNLDENLWIRNEEARKILPAAKFDFNSAVANRSFQQVSDSNYVYLFRFDDTRNAGTEPPIEYVKKEIVGIIINQRKINFVNKAHQTIYEEAAHGKQFEIYK